MFKAAGSVMIICSSVFIFCQKTLKCYFTYKFLQNLAEIIQKIQFENSANLTYKKLFEKINFDKNIFFANTNANVYIQNKEIILAESFFAELGKRDKKSEEDYIDYNLKKFIRISQEYQKKYNETKKAHLMCGVAAGLLVIIFLI